jgi:hypothetical protein
MAVREPGGYIDTHLTNISVKLATEDQIADAVCKRVPVAVDSGKIRKYGTNHLRQQNTVVTAKGKAPIFEFDMDTSLSFSCDPYGLAAEISPKEQRLYGPQGGMNVQEDVTRDLTEVVKIAHEIRTAAAITNTGSIANTQLTGQSRWSDYVNGQSHPFEDVKDWVCTCRANGGTPPNSMIMDWKTAVTAACHPDIVASKLAGPGPLSREKMLQIFRDFFDLEPYIGRIMYDTSNEGGTMSLSPVWGTDLVLAYIEPGQPGLRTKSAFATFTVQPGRQVYTQNTFNPPRGVEVLVWEEGLDSVLLNAKAAYIAQTVIA